MVRILEIVLPIFSIMLFAMWYGRRYDPDMSVTNRVNMDVFLPALTFAVIMDKSVDVRGFVGLMAAVAIVIVLTGLLAWPVSRLLRVDPKTLVPLAMFGNTGNIGLPLFLLAFREAALPLAIVVIFTQNVLHFSVGVRILDSRASLWKTIFSPLIVVTLLAIAMAVSGMQLPPVVLVPIKMLGEICIPLMLFALGVRLAKANLTQWSVGASGALATPLLRLLVVALVVPWLVLTPIELGVMYLFGILPPAAMNFMFAERYKQEPAKVASIVTVGHLVAFVSLPVGLAFVLPRFAPS